MKVIADGKGFTLVEILVAVAMLGVISMIAAQILNTAEGEARRAKALSEADVLLEQSRKLFTTRWEQRTPETGAQIRPGAPRGEVLRTFTISRRRLVSGDQVTFSSVCVDVPPGMERYPFYGVDIGQDNGTPCSELGDPQQVDLLVCPKRQRPVLRIERRVGDNVVFSADYPNPKTRARDGLAGGFCLVRTASFEFAAVFQQVVLTDAGNLAFRTSQVTIMLDDPNPYAPGGQESISYLTGTTMAGPNAPKTLPPLPKKKQP